MVERIGKDEFKQKVLTSDRPVLVEFYFDSYSWEVDVKWRLRISKSNDIPGILF